MIRRPPRSTLFPTRRSSDLIVLAALEVDPVRRYGSVEKLAEDVRSEEHTSELQSLAYLVCRLLLEKKKTTQSTSKRTIRSNGPAHTQSSHQLPALSLSLTLQ